MWHVDEGTLHAYLDERERPRAGALDADSKARVDEHVASCAACAARLHEAARLRDVSLAVLRDASPAVEPLAFEQLPSARTTPPRVSRRLWVPAAWAATVVLAVGAGWIGSQLWRNGPQATSSPRAAVRPTATRPTQTPPPTAAAEPASATTQRPSRVAVDAVVTGAPPTDLVGLQAASGAAKASPTVGVVASAPPPASATLELAAQEVSAYPGDADVAWQTVTKADAERLLRGPLYALEGEELTDVAISAGMVPVRQRTAQGMVELVQWRAVELNALAQLPRRRDVAAPMQLRAESKAADPIAPRAQDGGRYVDVPGTTHAVVLKAPAAVDPSTLLAKVKPLPLEGAGKR